ncbi:unnamed protein product [Toxocara canis]|uniref:FSA_C domain-containing protein n=1 Tax=Toxocara canis TaxID=6265 RepID=A0A183UQE3_TOXCA|nr:unnamed protein product [Toxocara canis]
MSLVTVQQLARERSMTGYGGLGAVRTTGIFHGKSDCVKEGSVIQLKLHYNVFTSVYECSAKRAKKHSASFCGRIAVKGARLMRQNRTCTLGDDKRMSRFLLPVPNATDELSVPFSERISIAWPHSELNGQKLLWLAFSLLLLFVWVLFLVLYLSRVLGPIVGRILTRMAHHFGYEGEIMMESFSLSLIGGRVLFRNATYICDDFSVHCEYGCIVFGYWIPLSDADIALESSEKSRLHLWLSGFDVHLYNSSMFRRGMTGGLGERVSSPKLNCSQDTVNKVKSQDAFYKMLWSLIGCVQLELFSTKIIVGNHLLPTVLAIHVERSQSQFSRRHSEVDGRQRVIHQTNAKNVEISFLKCEDFCESKSYRLSARTGPPPRTMGQEAVQIEDMSSPRPCCNIVMDLGSDVEIAYGPWADAQRLILMEFFYPVDYHIAELTKLPGAGESQILERVDLVVTAKENMHVDLWFTRDDELNVILTTIKRRATIEVSLPLTVDESGSEISLKCSLEGAVCSTSLAFRKLFQSDVINADIVAHIPRAYNGLQSWQLSLHLGHISAWFIWDHTTFFMDLMKEISLETLSDIFTFAPAIWKFTVECSDFEIIFILNDKNWIDASRPSGNLLASVVGSMMTAKFDIVKDDFCMPKSRFFADIKGRNSLAARFRLPDKSTMSPALQSLFKDAFFASYAPCVDLPANTELPVGWIDFWRTESASITVEFIYHPLYLDPCTDLPESAIPTKFTTKASHPLELDEDTLQITASFILA